MNREELDAFFAKADDVLTDWRYSDDSMKWRAPEWNFDCPSLPRNAGIVAAVAAREGIDGYAAAALVGIQAKEAVQSLIRGAKQFATQFATQFGEAMTQFSEAMKPLSEVFAKLNTAYTSPLPLGHRDRALALRKQRNTGPPARVGLDGHFRR